MCEFPIEFKQFLFKVIWQLCVCVQKTIQKLSNSFAVLWQFSFFFLSTTTDKRESLSVIRRTKEKYKKKKQRKIRAYKILSPIIPLASNWDLYKKNCKQIRKTKRKLH